MAILPANASQCEDNYESFKMHCTWLLAIDSVVAIMTLLGNGVFILVLAKKRSLHTPSNVLFGALAVSDLLVGIVAQPLWIWELGLIVADKYESNVFTISYIARWAFVLFSIIYITIVGLDRYIAVCFPIRYSAYATCKSHIIISILIFLLSFIGYVVGQTIAYKADTYIPAYFLTALIGASLLITGFFNFKVYSVVKQQKKQIRRLTFTGNYVQSSRPAHDTYKTMIIPVITLLLFICYAPMLILEILWGTLDEFNIAEGYEYIIQYWSEFLILLNSLINPLVYYARMKTFRKAAKVMVCSIRSEIAIMH